MTIDILLATYNGENYLEEQIDSILSQTYSDWNLIVRDDKSEDNTLLIIDKYSRKFSDRIFLVHDENDVKRLGASGNFGKLLKYSYSDYIFFCDQDDIWLPNKIEISLSRIKSLEMKYGKNYKLLVHTDMRVVDNKLNEISDSFFKYQNLNPENGYLLRRLLIQNVITGCSIVLNKALKDFAYPIPPDSIMHDWWLALVAVTFGKVDYLNIPTVLYRQHSQNDVGAKKWGLSYIFSRLFTPDRIHDYFNKTIIQSESFLIEYENKLNRDDYLLVKAYTNLNTESFWRKRFLLIKNGHYQLGDVRNLGLFLYI
jgi:glycosyltransferase involved in cell wall biosynthesis